VWLLDVTGGSLGRRDDRMSALDVLLLSFAITRQRLGLAEVAMRPGQTLYRLPAVNVGKHDLRDFSRTSELIELGYALGRRMVAGAVATQGGSELPKQRSGSASREVASAPTS
jgi:hypothetical protein